MLKDKVCFSPFWRTEYLLIENIHEINYSNFGIKETD